MTPPSTRCSPRILVLACFWLLYSGGAAFAQDPAGAPPQEPAGAIAAPARNPNSVKYHVSFALSGGFDLDLFGDLVMGALGEHNGTQVAVRQPRQWADFYVDVPKRAQATVGFGVFTRDELVVRVSKAMYTGEPFADAGNIAGPAGNQTLVLSLSDYRERAWEIGWRHYKMLTPRYKQYAQFLYGQRSVDPIRANFSALETLQSLGILRLYDKGTITTYSLEVGLTMERHHLGLYAEIGARWQHQLKRDDRDLVDWSFQPLNNTAPRFYLPAQFGVVFRM